MLSASPPITISNGEIYALLDVNCTEAELEVAADYARQKLEHCRNLYPDADHYDNEYLITLTGDCLREMAASKHMERRFLHGGNERVHALS
jgi:hypothetical protein